MQPATSELRRTPQTLSKKECRCRYTNKLLLSHPITHRGFFLNIYIDAVSIHTYTMKVGMIQEGITYLKSAFALLTSMEQTEIAQRFSK